MKTKKFDCVEMKQIGAEKVQREVAAMSLAEELAYWQSGTQSLQEKQRKLKSRAAKNPIVQTIKPE